MSIAVTTPTVVGRHRALPVSITPVTPAAAPASSTSAVGSSAGTSKGRGPWRRVASLVMTLAMVGSFVMFLFLAVGPHVLGYRTSTMLTGSMEPGIMPGDVVVTTQKPATDVHVGDVISYQIPIEDHRVETHRVTEVTTAKDGTISIRTQGDANSNVDPWTAILEEDTVWEVQAVIPNLGDLIQTMRSPIVHHVVKWVALGGLILMGLTTIWSRTDDDKDEDDENENEDLDEAARR
ncbi:signal peptidase I [Nocardioides sp. 503]|uniref:signal peptidase I n=1 Tax=Nocardioides sp. 503 TaxID=2508326 RepID=UPI00106FC61B|nr:signal peptidase I [Nocardioides sp. 503]